MRPRGFVYKPGVEDPISADLGIVIGGPITKPPLALTSASNHVVWDASEAADFLHVLTEDTTIDNPSGLEVGMEFGLTLQQHASSQKTVAYGTAFNFGGPGAPAPFVVIGVGKELHLSCKVRGTGAGGIHVAHVGGF